MMTIHNKNEKNYWGKRLGLPVISYGPAIVACVGFWIMGSGRQQTNLERFTNTKKLVFSSIVSR